MKEFPNSSFNDDEINYTFEQLKEYLQGADGAIIGLEQIDSKLLDQCPNLKIVSKYGVGLDNLDQDAIKERGIKIGWSPGVNKLSVAEETLGFMIFLMRNLYVTSNLNKNGIWKKQGGVQLTNKAVGIIGVGNIGKEIVRLLKPFNCKILANDIDESQEMKEFFKEQELIKATKEEIFKNSDIVSLHIPSTDQTKYLINSASLALMKPTAFIINTSRGPVVCEKDLKVALQENIIAGGALDVYEEEPIKDKELLKFENLICTPHIAGNSKEAVEAMGMSAINHLIQFFKG